MSHNVYTLANYVKLTNNLRKTDKKAYDEFLETIHIIRSRNMSSINDRLKSFPMTDEQFSFVIFKLSGDPHKEDMNKLIQFLKFYSLTN